MLMNFAAKATEVDLVKLLYKVSLPYKQFKTRGHHCNQDLLSIIDKDSQYLRPRQLSHDRNLEFII